MDLSPTLAEIVSLSVDERIRPAEATWDSIASEPGQPELTEAQQQELERRLAAHTASPEDVAPLGGNQSAGAGQSAAMSLPIVLQPEAGLSSTRYDELHSDELAALLHVHGIVTGFGDRFEGCLGCCGLISMSWAIS